MVKDFIELLRTPICHNPDRKDKFHSIGKRILRTLAKKLGYKSNDYDLRSNMGGDAVSGEVTLHADTLYVQFSQTCLGFDHGFMWRTCKGRRDYIGGPNHWSRWETLLDLDTLAQSMLAVTKRNSQGDV